MRAREREGRLAVVQRGPLPATGRVALGAGLTKLPVVFVVRLVTSHAVLGSPRVLAARVTLNTGNLPVSPCKRVSGCTVIKAGPLPAIGGVALRAGLTKLPAVFVVRLMAGIAVLGGSRVLVARMA